MHGIASFSVTIAGVKARVKRAPTSRATLRVVAHGGVGGSGGPAYAGKDKEFGSDQAPWKKKLILHDDDQADPEANSGRSGGKPWTPPPAAQVSTDSGFGGGAAAPAASSGGWDAPAAPPPPPPPRAASSGGGIRRGADGVVYDPDNIDPDQDRSRGQAWTPPPAHQVATDSGFGGGAPTAAPAASYGGGGGRGAGRAPARVFRGSDGVIYDPDNYDPDNN